MKKIFIFTSILFSFLFLNIYNVEAMNINFKIGDEDVVLDFEPTDTVEFVKKSIAKLKNINYNCIGISYNDTILSNEAVLNDYSILKDDTLEVTYRSCSVYNISDYNELIVHYDKNNDDIINIGDEVKIGHFSFNVIGNDGYDVELFSKELIENYNGNFYHSSGALWRSYEIIEGYVPEYKTYLNNMYNIEATPFLLTKEKVEELIPYDVLGGSQFWLDNTGITNNVDRYYYSNGIKKNVYDHAEKAFKPAITLSLDYFKSSNKIIIYNDISNGSVSLSINNDKITLSANPSQNYKFESLYLNGETVETNNGLYSFDNITENIYVDASFIEKEKITNIVIESDIVKNLSILTNFYDLTNKSNYIYDDSEYDINYIELLKIEEYMDGGFIFYRPIYDISEIKLGTKLAVALMIEPKSDYIIDSNATIMLNDANKSDIRNYQNSITVYFHYTVDKLEVDLDVTLDNWLYKETPKQPIVTSNYENNFIIEYKKVNESDDKYTTTVPEEVGNYMVRVISPETDTLKEKIVVKEFSILENNKNLNINIYYDNKIDEINNIIVNINSDKELIFYPRLGYYISQILINDVDRTELLDVNKLLIENIIEDTNVKVIMSPLKYEFLIGINQIYNNNDLIYKANNSLNIIDRIYINAQELNSKYFEIKDDILILNNEYLKTLVPNSYVLTILLNNKTKLETSFIVNEKQDTSSEEDKPTEEEPVEEDKPTEEEPVEEDKPIEEEPVEEDKPTEEEPVEEDKPTEEEPVEEDKPIEEEPVEEDKPIEEEPVGEDKPTEDELVEEERKKVNYWFFVLLFGFIIYIIIKIKNVKKS